MSTTVAASSRVSSVETFSSSAISALRSGGSASHPGAMISALASGWRVLTPEAARRHVLLPPVAALASSGSTAAVQWPGCVAVANTPRCTESGASGSVGATTARQIRSAMNGVSGAISRVTVSRHSWRVASAALPYRYPDASPRDRLLSRHGCEWMSTGGYRTTGTEGYLANARLCRMPPPAASWTGALADAARLPAPTSPSGWDQLLNLS